MPPFRPFKKGEFVQNADGSRSTERTITWQLPDGRWVNTPTLFMNDREQVIDLSSPEMEPQARGAAMALMRAGFEFPTFQNNREAESFAKERSAGGGVFQGELGTNPLTRAALSLRPSFPAPPALRPGRLSDEYSPLPSLPPPSSLGSVGLPKIPPAIKRYSGGR